jgi:CBS domain-containing protein
MIERVLHVLPDTDMAEAARILSDNSISGLPVIDADRRVVGVVSEKDILSQLGFKDKVSFMAIVTQCLQAGGCLSLPVRTPAVREIMSSPAITVSPRTPLVEIAKLLTEKGINRLPVTDPRGRLLGIVARSDIVNATLRSGTCSPNTSGK